MAEDPLRLIESLEDMEQCLEDGCLAPALPSGDAFLFGHDDQMQEVYIRKWTCAAGHFYHVEDDPPASA